MSSFFSTMHSLREMFDAKMQEFTDEVQNVHMLWLEEIQQEAVRMFSSDFRAEPELMPKTPSQKKSNRRKRASVGRVENHGKRRISRGTRSNLRRSSAQVVRTLGVIAEGTPVLSFGAQSTVVTKSVQGHEETASVVTRVPEPQVDLGVELGSSTPQSQPPAASHTSIPNAVMAVRISAEERQSAELQLDQMEPKGRMASNVTVAVPQESTRAQKASRRSSSRRISVRCSLSALRHSMTQEALRRASRRSFLKKRASLSSSCGEQLAETDIETEEETDGVLTEDPAEDAVDIEGKGEEQVKDVGQKEIRPITRSMAQPGFPAAPAASPRDCERPSTPNSDDSAKKAPTTVASIRSNATIKRHSSSTDEPPSPTKRPSPPIRSHSVVKPHMKSFLHTVQKNQMLMSTPGSSGRTAVIKSFIKHATPLKVDMKPASGLVERQRLRLETLKKKEEQETERRRKMEEEKKRRQDEMKRKRDERLRKVVEARVKEEQKEEEKKRQIEQKLAMMGDRSEKMKVERLAEEKAKKKVATKRQEELEQRKKQQEEEARRKKIQQEEEERRQQELLAKRRAEEEQERARKLAEAKRAQELRKEQEEQERARKLAETKRAQELERERERELEKERIREEERLRQQKAAAERERLEREKAEVLRRQLEQAAQEEKVCREAEERRLKEEQQNQEAEKAALQKQAAVCAAKEELQQTLMKTPVGKGTLLNVTVDVSPQSYEITPKGGNKTVTISNNPEDYGMDQNSEDSTDDESAPRKPIPSWAEGRQLQQALLHQYFNPIDVDSYFGEIEEPQLERIFYKSKPRYFKRTSSAVWNYPPHPI